MELFALGQDRKTRLTRPVEGAFHTELLASLVHQLGIVGVMHVIIGARARIENDGWTFLVQLGVSHKRGPHRLLNRKN